MSRKPFSNETRVVSAEKPHDEHKRQLELSTSVTKHTQDPQLKRSRVEGKKEYLASIHDDRILNSSLQPQDWKQTK